MRGVLLRWTIRGPRARRDKPFNRTTQHLALLARPVLRALNRAAAQSTAATVFEIHDDQVFFDSHHMDREKRPRDRGIDLEGFRRALVERPPARQLREELGLGTSRVVITVTRMTRGKGIPSLEQAKLANPR